MPVNPLFPTYDSTQDVIELAKSRLPISNPNEIVQLFQIYQNTLNKDSSPLILGDKEKIIVVSTAHVSNEERKAIDALFLADKITGFKRDEGWLIHCKHPCLSIDDLLLLPNLALLLQAADKTGVDWLMLDKDGAVLPDYPTFDW